MRDGGTMLRHMRDESGRAQPAVSGFAPDNAEEAISVAEATNGTLKTCATSGGGLAHSGKA